MILPQSRTAFKAVLVASLLLSSLAPVSAQDTEGTDDPRQTLFSCTTDEVDDAGFLSLEGVERDFDRWTDLRFVRTANGDGHEIYGFEPKDYKAAFLFSNSDGPEGYVVSIRWVDQGTNYVYYSLNIPPDPAVEDDAGGGAAGLVISKNGKLIEDVACRERPYMFISYMHDAMSCDTQNPFGEAACSDDDVYDRTEPFDISKVGLLPQAGGQAQSP